MTRMLPFLGISWGISWEQMSSAPTASTLPVAAGPPASPDIAAADVSRLIWQLARLEVLERTRTKRSLRADPSCSSRGSRSCCWKPYPERGVRHRFSPARPAAGARPPASEAALDALRGTEFLFFFLSLALSFTRRRLPRGGRRRLTISLRRSSCTSPPLVAPTCRQAGSRPTQQQG